MERALGRQQYRSLSSKRKYGPNRQYSRNERNELLFWRTESENSVCDNGAVRVKQTSSRRKPKGRGSLCGGLRCSRNADFGLSRLSRSHEIDFA